MTTQGVSVYENALTPATPAANYRTLFPKADGWHDLDDAGVDHLLLAPDANGVVGVNKPGQSAGLFLISVSNTNAVLGGGAYWNGAAWVANGTTAGTANLNASGAINFTVDSSLTPAATFTPTTRLQITPTAVVATVPLFAYKTDDLVGGPVVFYLTHNPLTVTPGAGYGTSLQFQAKSDTTVDTPLALIQATWATATHASRKSRLDLFVYDTTSRLAIRMESNGSNPMLGFYGNLASARPTVTGSRGGNAALASLLTQLATLGLITDSTS